MSGGQKKVREIGEVMQNMDIFVIFWLERGRGGGGVTRVFLFSVKFYIGYDFSIVYSLKQTFSRSKTKI